MLWVEGVKFIDVTLDLFQQRASLCQQAHASRELSNISLEKWHCAFSGTFYNIKWLITHT